MLRRPAEGALQGAPVRLAVVLVPEVQTGAVFPVHDVAPPRCARVDEVRDAAHAPTLFAGVAELDNCASAPVGTVGELAALTSQQAGNGL